MEADPPPIPTVKGYEYNPFPDDKTCVADVIVHSPALWDLPHLYVFLQYPSARLQLQLTLIFSLTQFLHFLLRRFHCPRFTSELLAGIILGPNVLGKIFKNFTKSLFPQQGQGQGQMDSLSKLGFAFYMFLSGVKMNPKLVLTSSAGNLTAWTVGILAAVIPFAGSLSLAAYCRDPRNGVPLYRVRGLKESAAVNNIVSFPVIFSLLNDLQIMNSELGRLALTSALISDLVSNTLLALATNIGMGYAGWNDMVGVLYFLLMLFAIVVVIAPARPLSRWIIARTPEGKPIDSVYVVLIAAGVLFSAILTHNAGLQYHDGPFIFGLALPDGPPIGSTLVLKLETLVCGLFAPLLVTYAGVKMDLFHLFDLEYLGFLSKVILGCLALKYVAVLFPALVNKMPVRDAFALSFIMSAQGIVQVSFYHIMFLLQTIDREVFSVTSFLLLVTATTTQLCAHALYDRTRIYTGYQKRDIQHLAYNAELRVLVSSSRVDEASAVKKILEASFPNVECPLVVYALILVELVGRAHPLLIDHQLGQKSSAVVGGQLVQKILEVFQSFRQEYLGMVSVQMFTAMSLPKFMHYDICSLAFDKMTSMIILPFHIKWNNQGKMIANNSSVRVMNCRVLDMAPCSVGILVDRHRIKTTAAAGSHSSTYNVAIIFIGGNDDREALAYGKRMARLPGVHLSIVRFLPWDPASLNQWDAVVDAEMLKEMRLLCGHQDNVVYREEQVKDGADSALIIHGMEDGYDLIVVGRRHREDAPQLSGLNEWNVLPELGSVGDMLASSEIMTPVSVLVVQQQILRIK